MSPFVNKETGTFPTKVSFQIQHSVCLKFHVSDRKISISLKFAEQRCDGVGDGPEWIDEHLKARLPEGFKSKRKNSLVTDFEQLVFESRARLLGWSWPCCLFPLGT